MPRPHTLLLVASLWTALPALAAPKAKPPVAETPAPFAHLTCDWRPEDVDTTKLAAILQARNFHPPPNFRAFWLPAVNSGWSCR